MVMSSLLNEDVRLLNKICCKRIQWIISIGLLCGVYLHLYLSYEISWQSFFSLYESEKNLSVIPSVTKSSNRVSFLTRENNYNEQTPYKKKLKKPSPALFKRQKSDEKYLTFEEDPSYYLKKLMAYTLQMENIEDSPKSHSVQIIIITSWRSGSSFLEAIFNSYPGTFDIHEPLHEHGLDRIIKGHHKYERLENFLYQLLKCRVEDKLYLNYVKHLLILKNELYKDACVRGKNDDLCAQKSFFELTCSLFPRMLLKVVRAEFGILERPLMDPSLNPKAILLVRDPRGTFSSRVSSIKWCQHFCLDVSRHCKLMNRDLDTFLNFKKKFGSKVLLIRYEDLVLSPSNYSKKVMEHFGLDFTEDIEVFLKNSTNNDDSKDPLSTSRISSERAILWTKILSMHILKNIQRECGTIMKRLGYRAVDNLNGTTISDVILPLEDFHLD